ncbi:hypothetical protein A9G13_06970 [Gilliamella sp. wkB178]|nr:hypothetical protein A9G13_06970 [Gilliamella apicola]
MLKKLVTGELSLVITFWGWLVLGNIILAIIVNVLFSTITQPNPKVMAVVIIVILLIKFIIAGMVTSGIFFILRNKKITVWGVIAFILALINFIYAIIYAAACIYAICFVANIYK